MVPSAPACSTRVMLLHPSIVEKRPLGGRQHPSDPSSQEGCYLGVWGRGIGFGGISRFPDYAGCALHLPPRAGGRRWQLRAMQDPSPSRKTCLHLARVAHVPLCFCVHGKHGHGSKEDAQDGASDATWASPAAILRHITNVSGHHLLKTCCQRTPTPGAAKLPISPQGSLSGRVHGQQTDPRVCWKKEQTCRFFPQAHSPQGRRVRGQPGAGAGLQCTMLPPPCQAVLPVPALPNRKPGQW